MTEPPYRLSREAVADLDAIIDYILLRSGPIRADHVTRRFAQTLLSLSSIPNVGRKMPMLDGTPCKYLMPPWVIFYEPDEGGIFITRIYDGRRNLNKLLRQYKRPQRSPADPS